MTNEQIAHDLALLAAKEFIQSNRPEYKVTGYEECICDLLEKYQAAYKQIIKNLD